MSDLLSLLDSTTPSPVHRGDPETSAAASQAAAKRAPAQRRAVLQVLDEAGRSGLSDYEISVRLGITRSSAGKRRGELTTSGYVEPTGERRRTDTNSTALVWRVNAWGALAADQARQEEAERAGEAT